MVAGANLHSEMVEQHPRVVVVSLSYEEGNHGGLSGSCSEQPYAFDTGHAFECVFHEAVLVGSGFVGTYVFQKLHGAGECGGSYIVRGAGFEFIWQVGPGGMVEAHMADHLAAALVWRHGLEKAAATVEYAYAGGTVHLV